MTRCNLDLMVQFSCEELREKRIRAIVSVAEDERLLRSLDAQIRSHEIRIANHNDRIVSLRGDMPMPGRLSPVQHDETRRPKRPSVGGIIVDNAEAILRQIQNGREIGRLEGEIERLETRILELSANRESRTQRLNEAQNGRRCIQDAMWRKQCGSG